MTTVISSKLLSRRYAFVRTSTILHSRILTHKNQGLWHLYLPRCNCTSQPKDTVDPPTKFRRQITNAFTSFIDRFEKKLEKSTPKAFNVYKTIKNVRLIVSDARSYFYVSAQLWSGRELHTFSRKELEIYLDMPKDIVKVSVLLLIFMIPFAGNLIIASMYWFPRTFFTPHLWNDDQKVEFRQYFHRKRLGQYHHILQAVNRQTVKQMAGEQQEKMLQLLDKMNESGQPTVEELLQVKQSFESFPFSLDVLPTSYYRHIAKSCGLTKRRVQLQQDGLVLLHIDRAMVREGIETMTESDICKECLRRGLNPYDIENEERIKFLTMWTNLSQQLDENNVSLLLHCPTFLTYNAKSNIQLMKGAKYRWHRR